MKRKKTTEHDTRSKNIKRSQSTDDVADLSQLTQLTQQSSSPQSIDSSDWEDQDDCKTCGVCKSSLDLASTNDNDPIEHMFCDNCGIGFHLRCLRVESVIDGPLKDLISLIGWKCNPCKVTLKQKLQKLENTVTTLKSEITKLKTANTNMTRELAILKSSHKSFPNIIDDKFQNSDLESSKSNSSSNSTSDHAKSTVQPAPGAPVSYASVAAGLTVPGLAQHRKHHQSHPHRYDDKRSQENKRCCQRLQIDEEQRYQGASISIPKPTLEHPTRDTHYVPSFGCGKGWQGAAPAHLSP